MKIIIVFIFSLFLFVNNIFSQHDTLNQSYFTNLRKDLLKDSTIKEIKYYCKKFKNGEIDDQHIYVKYKNDSLDRYWQIGKCFHYYKSGNLLFSDNIDLKSKMRINLTATLKINGDTIRAFYEENYNNKQWVIDYFVSAKELGKISEIRYDKIVFIDYKKGRRIVSTTEIYDGQKFLILKKVYFNKDGSIKKVVNNKNYAQHAIK